MAFDVSAVLNECLRLHTSGKLKEAEAGYRAILAHDPNQPDALGLMGALANQHGRPMEALALLERALERGKRNPTFHMQKGMALCSLGRFEDGLLSLRQAARLDPKSKEVPFNLGVALDKSGRTEEAVPYLEKACVINASNPYAHVTLGGMQARLGRFAAAAKAFREAVKIAPRMAAARYQLIQALIEIESFEEAEEEARRAVETDPKDAKARRMLGQVLNKRDRYAEALPLLEQVVAENPQSEEAVLDLGNALRGLERFDEALALYRDLLQRFPHLALVNYNVGQVEMEEGRLDAALTAFDKTLAADPNFIRAHVQRASILLLQGRNDEAYPEWDWRWRYSATGRPFPQPAWTGQDLTGKSIVVWGEQGIGDELVYFSLLATLKGLGAARVLVECDPRLRGVLQRANPDMTVLARKAKPARELMDKNIDFQIACGDIMRYLPHWPDRPVRSTGHIKADPELQATYRAWLKTTGLTHKVGVSWLSKRAALGRMKSAPLDQWGPILGRTDATFINLQYGDTEADTHGRPIHTHPSLDRFNDIDGMCALIEELDLVITTSNVTAHLAGALGKPCWLLTSKTPLWYWGLSGPEVQFYASVRAFRQTDAADWAPVMTAVASELAKL